MKREIHLFDALIIYVCIVSLLNIFLLAIHSFYPLISLGIGLLICVSLGLIFKFKISFKDNRFSWIFLIVVVIALGLRLTPNLYLTGGQDQGTYVSLSKQYDVNHSLYITDNVRQSLSVELKGLYDKANSLLGIKLIDESTSTYVMPFYPVFPSWMSTFGTLFGSDNRIYALTFFSLLSITAVYLFAYEISDRNKKVALLASFLLAINPAHVYFSRVPLTEIVSITMFFMSLYYLLKFYTDYKKQEINTHLLIFSLIAITVLFYTRMTALLYLPVILLVPLLLMLFCKDKKLTKYLFIYCGIWVVSLLLSYLFYYHCLPDLFNLIMGKRMGGILEVKWVGLSIFLGYLLVMAVLCIKQIKTFLTSVIKKYSKYIYILVLILFVGLIGYELFRYVDNTFILHTNSILSNMSLSNLKQMSVLVTFFLFSPLLFLLLPFAFFHFRKKYGKEINMTFMLVLLIIFLTYCWGILRLTPYYYYYTRYQLSELIPLCTIFVSMYLVSIFNTKRNKILVTVIVVLSSLYMGYFSILQLRSYEGLNKSKLQEINTLVGTNDVLVVVQEDFKSFNQVIFPLKYYFNTKIIQISSKTDLENKGIKDLKNIYDKVYVLSANQNLGSIGLGYPQEEEFENNYFVHCNRSEDAFFDMKGYTKDIPLCKYIVVPNRYYFGSETVYLYLWK